MKALFDKCLELNGDRMAAVQGFTTSADGQVAPQFASDVTQKAFRLFKNPDKFVSRAKLAREISDRFIEQILIRST